MMTITKNAVILAAILFLFCFEKNIGGQKPDFKVNVPDRANVALDIRPISEIEVYVDVLPSATYPVNFEIAQPPVPGGEVLTFDVSTTPEPDDFQQFPGDPPDSVQITALDPDGTGSVKRFLIKITLDSNWSDCFVDDLSGPETWEIRVTDTQFIAACINSYEAGGDYCTAYEPIQPGDDPAEIDDFPDAGILCDFRRPAVDVMLVLDKSGSMGWEVTGGGGKIKMKSLRDAVKDFVDVWGIIGAETGDRLGVVFFDYNEHDFTDYSSWSSYSAGLNDFNTTLRNDLYNNIETEPDPGSSTSIGDGLEMAATELDSEYTAGKRQAILLMSNGKQNTTRMVSRVGDEIKTHDKGSVVYSDLDGIDNIDIWTVSVGAAVDISATILQDIAEVTGGFYINTEDDPDLLRPFFLELLQNFVRFNTIETTNIRGGTITTKPGGGDDIYTFTVNTSSTAKKLIFSLMWRKEFGDLSMQVFLPDGTELDSSHFSGGPDSIRVSPTVPVPPPEKKGIHTGPWKVQVKVVRNLKKLGEFPFYFHSLVDDDVVKSGFDIPGKDYGTGETIPLQVKLEEFHRPIVNKNNSITVKAKVAMPGQGMGELLSNNTPTGSSPPDPPDPDTQAATETEKKLDLLLQENPDLLSHNFAEIELFDDGKSAHGDAVKDDGIYSGLYKDTEHAGHYTFLFSAEGQTQKTGPISRQQIKTVHVRPKPSADATETKGDAGIDNDTRYVSLKMTPKDKFGHKLGPGYDNYFIISPSYVGGKKLKFEDKNLDGVYDLYFSVPTSESVPKINVNFVTPSVILSDEVDPEKIPPDLQKPFIKDFPIQGDTGRLRGIYLSLHGGYNIPHSNFSNLYDGKLSLAVDLEYRLDSKFSFLLFGGYNRFEPKTGSGLIDDLKISNISLNGKFYLWSSGNLSFFVNGGGGYYIFDPGDNKFGFNLGGGLQFRVNQQIAVEGWYNYHNVWTSGTATKFSTFLAGFNIRL